MTDEYNDPLRQLFQKGIFKKYTFLQFIVN